MHRSYPSASSSYRSFYIAAIFSVLLTLCAVATYVMAYMTYCVPDANFIEEKLCAILTGSTVVGAMVMILLVSWIVTVGAYMHARREG